MLSPIRVDNSFLSRFDQRLHRVESALNLTSGVVILALVLLAATNVLGRKLLNAPLPGFIDWVEQAMGIFAFAGLAYCQRSGGHIRMDFVIQRLRGRRLWLSEFLASVFMLLITSALIYGTYSHFARSFDPASPFWSRDSSIDIGLPLWPTKLVVPLALALLWVRLLIQATSYLIAFVYRQETPIAVPLPQTVAEQAANQSELVAHVSERNTQVDGLARKG